MKQLATLAEARGGQAGRRDDGAYFTDADVAAHLVRRVIGARLLDAAGTAREVVDEALADGDDLHELLRQVTVDGPVRARVARELGRLVVLDPSCGAGSFLVAAWSELLLLAELVAPDGPLPSPMQLRGVDLDLEAVDACRAVLEIATAGHAGSARIEVGDAQVDGVLPRAEVLVGNPPFVRATADARVADLATATVPNRSAWIVERALAAAAPGARTAFVLPVSTACADAFAPARGVWSAACDRVFASHFDTIPSSLFRGVVQRLSILEGRVRDASDHAAPARWWTTRYHRWTQDERAGLLAAVRFVPMPPETVDGSIAKVGTRVEAGLLKRLFAHPPAERLMVARGSRDFDNRLLYKRRWSYFLLFSSYEPPMWGADGRPRSPSELKSLEFGPDVDAHTMIAVYSSSLFWWYFSVFTDNRNVNRRDLGSFPLPVLDETIGSELATLGRELMDALRACSEVRTCTYRSIGTIRNTYFRQGETRPVLDRVDARLADAYGLDAEQLEFVLGFERRFRSTSPPRSPKV